MSAGTDFPLHLDAWSATALVGDAPVDVEPVDVTPGLLGFLVTLAVVVASIVLFRSMAAKVRGVQRRDPDG